MAKKWLYTFTINKETEVEKREKSTKDGKDIETVEKVKETAPVEFLLQKPTRKLFDEAELFYGVNVSIKIFSVEGTIPVNSSLISSPSS